MKNVFINIDETIYCNVSESNNKTWRNNRLIANIFFYSAR